VTKPNKKWVIVEKSNFRYERIFVMIHCKEFEVEGGEKNNDPWSVKKLPRIKGGRTVAVMRCNKGR
jgi:hypothetical protein